MAVGNDIVSLDQRRTARGAEVDLYALGVIGVLAVENREILKGYGVVGVVEHESFDRAMIDVEPLYHDGHCVFRIGLYLDSAKGVAGACANRGREAWCGAQGEADLDENGFVDRRVGSDLDDVAGAGAVDAACKVVLQGAAPG